MKLPHLWHSTCTIWISFSCGKFSARHANNPIKTQILECAYECLTSEITKRRPVLHSRMIQVIDLISHIRNVLNHHQKYQPLVNGCNHQEKRADTWLFCEHVWSENIQNADEAVNIANICRFLTFNGFCCKRIHLPRWLRLIIHRVYVQHRINSINQCFERCCWSSNYFSSWFKQFRKT